MREITRALADPGFADVDRRGAEPVAARYATMTEYEEDWPYPVAFPPAPAEGDAWPQSSRASGGCGSCTSRRPRSTRT